MPGPLKHVSEGEQKTCCVPEKTSIEVEEPEEMLKFEACRMEWKLDNSLYMTREWPDSRGQNQIVPSLS